MTHMMTIQPGLCKRCGKEFTPRLHTTTVCFACWQEEDHAIKDAFYRPIIDGLAELGIQAYVEPELGGGGHALRVPFEIRVRPGSHRPEAVRSALLTLDGDAWLLGYYNDLANGWPDEGDTDGTHFATLSVAQEDLPGPWSEPPSTAEAKRITAWLESLIRDWGWRRRQPNT